MKTANDSVSAFLLGRDANVAHIVLNHESCSSQHAVIQFRKKLKTRELTPQQQVARGTFDAFVQEFIILPYLIDLESTNGSILNGDKIDSAKYYELRDKDVIKFGINPIDYVFMKKND